MPQRNRGHRLSQYGAVLAAGVVAAFAGAAALAGGGGGGAAAAAEVSGPAGRRAPAPAPVLTGIDVLLAEGAGPLRGKRVGLITNHTGKNRAGASTIDLLFEHPEVELVALFGPEHGLRGAAQAGEKVASGRDEKTGLPIHSLYGSTNKPTPEMLEGLDALVFDIQDIGSRYYTYVWTMALAMQAAAEHGVEFVVLDRPNPIGGEHVQGNVLDPAHASFVGLYPVPMRHGLTAGEIARYVNGEHGVGAKLTVVPAAGWSRAQYFEATGLPWTPPSPNMPAVESALHYPGTCLFEGTNLSVGRGLPTAFQQIGAAWVDEEELARRLNALGLPGVRFEPVTFPAVNPERQSHLGEKDPRDRRGVRFVATNRASYDPTVAAVAALVEIRRLHPDSLRIVARGFDRLAGTTRLRERIEAGASAAEIAGEWRAPLAAFRETASKYLLYR